MSRLASLVSFFAFLTLGMIQGCGRQTVARVQFQPFPSPPEAPLPSETTAPPVASVALTPKSPSAQERVEEWKKGLPADSPEDLKESSREQKGPFLYVEIKNSKLTEPTGPDGSGGGTFAVACIATEHGVADASTEGHLEHVVDLDGDGREDAVLSWSGETGNSFGVFLNKPTGPSEVALPFLSGISGFGGWSVTLEKRGSQSILHATGLFTVNVGSVDNVGVPTSTMIGRELEIFWKNGALEHIEIPIER